MDHFPLTIVFDDLDADLVGVDLHVYVEDIAQADAPSKLLQHQTVPNVTIPHRRPIYVARLNLPTPGRDAQASIRVHADTTRSGSLTTGDYLSTSVCLVPRTVPARGLDIHIHRI